MKKDLGVEVEALAALGGKPAPKAKKKQRS